jgi:hypothetical protein
MAKESVIKASRRQFSRKVAKPLNEANQMEEFEGRKALRGPQRGRAGSPAEHLGWGAIRAGVLFIFSLSLCAFAGDFCLALNEFGCSGV